MRAIIIDPSRSYRQLLRKILNEHDIEVSEAGGIADANHLLAEAPPDLLCLAMSLPDGDSAKFCMQVRVREDCHKTPILMLTTSQNREAAHRCLAAGVTEIFRKQEFALFDDYVGRLIERQRLSGAHNGGAVLYLEDSRAIAAATLRILTEAGFQVDHFSRAEDGIKAFQAKEYDLVLTDIVLEGQMTGTALLEEVRQHEDPARRTVPVVAVSAYDDTARRLQLFRAGVNDYVTKPVLSEELLARVSALVVNRQLLSRLADSHERMQKIAMTDQLCGLANRHYLMEAVPARLLAALNSKRPMSLLIVDLDHFKRINDEYGHAAGDAVIRDVGALLARYDVGDDLVARYGGEEFLLLLSDCDLAEARQRGESLRRAIADLQPEGIALSASIGIATLRPGDDYDTLFGRADQAVYSAKDAGRNCIVCA